MLPRWQSLRPVTDYQSGNATDDRVRTGALRNDGSGSNHGARGNRDARCDDRVCADPHVVTDSGRFRPMALGQNRAFVEVPSVLRGHDTAFGPIRT